MLKKYTVLLTEKHCVERGYGMVNVESVSANSKEDAIRKAIEKNELTYERIYLITGEKYNPVAINCKLTKKNDYKAGSHFFTSMLSSKTPVIVVDESI